MRAYIAFLVVWITFLFPAPGYVIGRYRPRLATLLIIVWPALYASLEVWLSQGAEGFAPAVWVLFSIGAYDALGQIVISAMAYATLAGLGFLAGWAVRQASSTTGRY